ncbi:MAG: winged helix-turn-helix transcriptional regulator [Candidatus Geothermarchaeales archaeon]
MNIFELLALRGARIALLELRERGGMRYSDLAKAVGHSTTTSRALNAMEGMGLVKREVLAEKYRPVVYSLTEKGERLAEIALTLRDFEEE